MIKRISLNFSSPILLSSAYYYISVRLTYKFYLVFNLISYAIIGVYIILEFTKLVRKKDETQKFKIIEAACIIFFTAAMLYFKVFVDNRNLLILKTSNQNVPVRQILTNYTEVRKASEKYDSTFKTIQHKDNTLYFTDEFEPALKLVQAYLDKARQDNSRLFGDIATGELKVKFDYDEQVFKKRNPTSTYKLQVIYDEILQEEHGTENVNTKALEQRIRRTIQKALETISELGCYDYSSSIFMEYSTLLFDFKQVRQEMRHINNESEEPGKINTKKFIESIITKLIQ